MVENVKEFGSELGGQPFLELPVLDYRKIPVSEAAVAEDMRPMFPTLP